MERRADNHGVIFFGFGGFQVHSELPATTRLSQYVEVDSSFEGLEGLENDKVFERVLRIVEEALGGINLQAFSDK